MAQYAVLIYAQRLGARPGRHARGPRAPATSTPTSCTDTGAMVAAYALTPRDMATSIRDDTITDGPFVDSKEIVAGFYVLEAPDLDAALAIARHQPRRARGGGGASRSGRSTAAASSRTPQRLTARVTDPSVPSRPSSPTRTAASGRGCSPARCASARDLDLAEECVQEAYAAALESLGPRRHPGQPGRLADHHGPAARDRRAAAGRRRCARRLPLLVEPEAADEVAMPDPDAGEPLPQSSRRRHTRTSGCG